MMQNRSKVHRDEEEVQAMSSIIHLPEYMNLREKENSMP